MAFHAVPGRDEGFLRRAGMDDQHVAVAVAGIAQGLPGADRDHPHLDPAGGGELRQQPGVEA